MGQKRSTKSVVSSARLAWLLRERPVRGKAGRVLGIGRWRGLAEAKRESESGGVFSVESWTGCEGKILLLRV